MNIPYEFKIDLIFWYCVFNAFLVGVGVLIQLFKSETDE